MITAVIDAGQHYCQAVSDLWQWDYGQTLRIQGVKLPAAVEVQFSTTERIGETVTRIGVTQEGVTEVPIPDTLLDGGETTQDYTIYAFVYIENGDSGKTEYRVSMKVRARPKPEAHATPEEGELFRQAIVAVAESADRAESARKSAETSADEAKTAKENAETAVKVAEAFSTELSNYFNIILSIVVLTYSLIIANAKYSERIQAAERVLNEVKAKKRELKEDNVAEKRKEYEDIMSKAEYRSEIDFFRTLKQKCKKNDVRWLHYKKDLKKIADREEADKLKEYLSENFPLTQQIKIILQYVGEGIIVVIPILIFMLCFLWK